MNPSERKTLSREDYSKGLEKMMMSFGSSQAKKVWSAAKRNYIDSERLEETLAPAVTHAETETDRGTAQCLCIQLVILEGELIIVIVAN